MAHKRKNFHWIELINPVDDKDLRAHLTLKMNALSQNPFFKFLTKEDLLHILCFMYFEYKLPGIIVMHVPNEGRRTPFERFKYSLFGVKKGVVDILIFDLQIAIELKIGNNKPTSSQKKWLEIFRNLGWDVYVCRSLVEVIGVVKNKHQER